MAWYNRFIGEQPDVDDEKLNPAQPDIKEDVVSTRTVKHSYIKFYENLEVVNRGVNLVVDDSCGVNYSVGEKIEGMMPATTQKYIKQATVHRLLNVQPNPWQDAMMFRTACMIDFLLEGNVFIYFDGQHLYHLPANKVQIHGHSKTWVEKYTYNHDTNYKPHEIIHIKENSYHSVYRGVSRLKPAQARMQLLYDMREFQSNFFKNGAVPGLVIKSPNTLNAKLKERLITSWMAKYNPKNGGRRPMILDGGLELDTLNKVDFREMDFTGSIDTNDKIVLKALGVPPILLDSGNNANIRPNLRMYYLETIVPILNRFNSAFERFFGFEIGSDLADVLAMQPEMKEQSAFYVGLVNGGIITANEAREALGFDSHEDEECDCIRVPANIAGSAANPNEGGKPPKPDETEDED